MKRAQEDQYQHLLCQNGASESSKIKFVEHKSKQKLLHSLVRKAFISFRCLDAFDPDTCCQFFYDTFINFSLIYKLKNYCALKWLLSTLKRLGGYLIEKLQDRRII